MQWGSFKVLASHIWDTLNTEDLSQNPAETVKRARCSTLQYHWWIIADSHDKQCTIVTQMKSDKLHCTFTLSKTHSLDWWTQVEPEEAAAIDRFGNVGSDGTTSHKHFGLLCLHTSAACGSPVWEPEGSKYVCGAAEFHECHLQPNSLTGCDGRKRHGCSLRRLHGDCSALAKPFGQISLES